MDIGGADITGSEILFTIREYVGKPSEYLAFIPSGYINYRGDLDCDYINFQIRLGVYRGEIVVDDHVSVGDLRRLHVWLQEPQNRVGHNERFITVDGQLELNVEWRTNTHDVRFSGRIPSFDYPELVDRPHKLRDGVYRILSFQFALEATSLGQPIGQIQELLDLVATYKEQT